LILPELIKFGFRSSDTACHNYFLRFQGFTTLTAKLFLLISRRDQESRIKNGLLSIAALMLDYNDIVVMWW